MPRLRAVPSNAFDFMRCRTYGHSWDEYFPTDLDTPKYGWRLSLRCTRCTTERHDIVNRNGGVDGRRYVYPDGYRTEPGVEAWKRDDYREALFEGLRAQLARNHALSVQMQKRGA